MIDRYTPSEMKDVFSDKSRFEAYLAVEIAVLEAQSELGIVSKEDVKKVKEKAKVDLPRIYELEGITKHDVVAFTRSIDEKLGEEKRLVHFGLTSTDVVDTALALLYKKANDLIERNFQVLLETIKGIALRYKNQKSIARTHGMHAEVTSFGLRFVGYFDEGKRALENFERARCYVECAKLSGAVGNFANVDPFVQERVAKKLGLESASFSTQVLSRDRHEHYASSIAIGGSLIEKIALEIRNLSRSEIAEVEEGFGKGQKGSSAMPQKRNPISSENLTGDARMLRGYLLPILEDNALFHERDISHSSVERVALIDMVTLFDYMLIRMNNVLSNLRFFPQNMERNIALTHGAIYSQKAMNALILKGMVREKAYDLVQPLAMKSILEGKEFEELLRNEKEIYESLKEEGIKDLFSDESAFKNIDYIYKKVGIE